MKKKLTPLLLAAFYVVGCESAVLDDPTLNLTGTEESPLGSSQPGNVISCPPEKELICHIPPGNPANAHSICVGKPAVKAHVKHHGDPIGPCQGDTQGPSQPPPPPPPPCLDTGADCMGGGSCCQGLVCIDGTCGPVLPPPPPACLDAGADCMGGGSCCQGLVCIDGVCSDFQIN